MICPRCKAQYRPGFSICADCQLPLVDAPAVVRAAHEHAEEETAEEPGDPNRDPFCSFWKGTDPRICAEICGLLDEAGIPHKTIHRQDHLFHFADTSPYEIGVPASLYEKAGLVVQEAFSSAEEYDAGEALEGMSSAPEQDPVQRGARDGVAKLLEAPAYEALDELPATPDASSSGGERWREKLRDVQDVDFEERTVEVWNGEPADLREMIEMSLAENEISSRWEEPQGDARLLVTSANERRAREIVREILEGTPLDE